MAHGEVRYSEEVQIGEQLGPVAKVITPEMVLQFCLSWGSAVPNRFTDDEVARKEGLPNAIVPGSQLRHLETLFRRPVPHNQPLRLTGTVSAKSVADGSDQVECDVHLLRDDGETLVTGSAVVTLPSRAG